jgi:hypothetical protein
MLAKIMQLLGAVLKVGADSSDHSLVDDQVAVSRKRAEAAELIRMEDVNENLRVRTNQLVLKSVVTRKKVSLRCLGEELNVERPRSLKGKNEVLRRLRSASLQVVKSENPAHVYLCRIK